VWWSGERASEPLTRPTRSRRIERRSDGADRYIATVPLKTWVLVATAPRRRQQRA
jgi:hypothetical protein